MKARRNLITVCIGVLLLAVTSHANPFSGKEFLELLSLANDPDTTIPALTKYISSTDLTNLQHASEIMLLSDEVLIKKYDAGLVGAIHKRLMDPGTSSNFRKCITFSAMTVMSKEDFEVIVTNFNYLCQNEEARAKDTNGVEIILGCFHSIRPEVSKIHVQRLFGSLEMLLQTEERTVPLIHLFKYLEKINPEKTYEIFMAHLRETPVDGTSRLISVHWKFWIPPNMKKEGEMKEFYIHRFQAWIEFLAKKVEDNRTMYFSVPAMSTEPLFTDFRPDLVDLIANKLMDSSKKYEFSFYLRMLKEFSGKEVVLNHRDFQITKEKRLKPFLINPGGKSEILGEKKSIDEK